MLDTWFDSRQAYFPPLQNACIYTSKMNSREIIAKLEGDGGFKVAQKGSMFSSNIRRSLGA